MTFHNQHESKELTMKNDNLFTWSIEEGPKYATGGYVGTSPTIRTAQIQAGHVGQIWNAGKIVWESRPYKTAAKAHQRATAHRDERLAAVFA